ncbi:lipoprotein-releasing ABC transporter permease subunit LolE [Thalassotalea sp. PLHSN55]|uniref:lipoprotein-releasing ABC transporter permease subunit LolE n=1 Tax=Thalassotalea sp. PLHSN55 TaxID=3435888 RepID=UPI003F8421FD
MFKPLSLFLGFRYVRSRQGNGFSSFISASSTFGIALGVLVLIVVLSAMNGFERELSQRLLSIVAHGEMVTVNTPIDNWPKEVQKVQQHPQVVAAAPLIKLTGMMQKGDELKGVELRGVDLKLESLVSDITTYVKQGSWQSLAQGNQIVIGSGIAKKLGVSIGDKVQVLLPKTAAQGQPLSKKFPALLKQNYIVGGIFQFGGTIDETLAYVSLAQAAESMQYQVGQAQGIRVKVNDVFMAPQVIREVANNFNYHVYIYDWTRTQGHVFNDIQLVRMVMFIVLVLVIAVASFNIVSTLIMAVNEKQSDIAILKTMGASPPTVMLAFIVQGVMNGVLGSVIGTILGVYVSLNLTDIILAIEGLFNTKILSADVYFIDFIPSELHISDVYFTVVTALVLSLLATIYPAWRATKIEPAKVLGQA